MSARGRSGDNNRAIKTAIRNLSQKDKARLLQCVFCKHNPDTCGKSEADEDADGMCKDYLGDIVIKER